jgi:hypothetical protein
VTGFKPCNGACIADDDCCGCSPDQTCVSGTCEAKRCGLVAPCRVFVTSTTYQGDLREGGQGSGVAGADAKCQARAQAGGLTGTYKAWISGGTLASSPSQRFTNIANTGPYVLLDANATVIAANWTDLTDGTLEDPISVGELGEPVALLPVWTHTLVDGTPGGTANTHCLEWTNATGANGGDNGLSALPESPWTVFSNDPCDAPLRLYCFEQG